MENITYDAPQDKNFWDVLTQGVDFVSDTLNKYYDLQLKKTTNDVLSKPNSLQFFTTGYGLIALMIFVLLLFWILSK